MVLHARSSPHSMFMQPKTINDKNFDAKHKTFSDTDNALGLEQISVYAFLSLAIDIPFLCLLRVCGEAKYAHTPMMVVVVRLMYVSLGKCVEIREMSPKHVHYAVKQGIGYILSHET